MKNVGFNDHVRICNVVAGCRNPRLAAPQRSGRQPPPWPNAKPCRHVFYCCAFAGVVVGGRGSGCSVSVSFCQWCGAVVDDFVFFLFGENNGASLPATCICPFFFFAASRKN